MYKVYLLEDREHILMQKHHVSFEQSYNLKKIYRGQRPYTKTKTVKTFNLKYNCLTC